VCLLLLIITCCLLYDLFYFNQGFIELQYINLIIVILIYTNTNTNNLTVLIILRSKILMLVIMVKWYIIILHTGTTQYNIINNVNSSRTEGTTYYNLQPSHLYNIILMA
jgi:hypothetical protein